MWVNDRLVQQIEARPDASVVADEELLRSLSLLGRAELAELSQAVAGLHVRVLTSPDEEELRTLRDAEDAFKYESRSLDGEFQLHLPNPALSVDHFVEGLHGQVLAVPLRWRLDVAVLLFNLTADMLDTASARARWLRVGRPVVGLLAVVGVLVVLWFTRLHRTPRT